MFSYLKDKLTGDEDAEKQGEDDEGSEDEGESFLSKARDAILTTTLDEETFDDLFWELELALLENNVAKPVVDALREDLHEDLVDTDIDRGSAQTTVQQALREAVATVLSEPDTSFDDRLAKTKPLTVVVVGVNGSGKTTTVAKLVKRIKDKDKTAVLGAADTYRAAAIQQIEEHAEALDTKLIKHDYGADPAAVAYDTVQHAESAGKDAALIDTAGRLHNDDNLMQQLDKVIRVAEPDLTLYVAESVTGNDAVTQIEAFQDYIDIDGVIMSKVDTDEKGGAVLSVSYVTGAPIYFLGTGQGYDDLDQFETETMLERIGL